jgi:hypothetical protein
MTVRRLAAVDAQTYWLAAKIPSDQFLVYGFAGAPRDVAAAVEEVMARARACAALGLRIQERPAGRYPVWAPRAVDDSQVVLHPGAGHWAGCVPALLALADDPLDAQLSAWRLHVFTDVDGLPGAGGPGTVAVVQMSHALADGLRSSALAAWLFGRAEPVVPVPGPSRWEVATLPARAVRAARSQRRLARDVEAGVVAPQANPCPVLRSNARPEGRRQARTLVRARAQLPGPTVTVGVLAALAEALAGHLRGLGDDTAGLGAEVPMTKTSARQSNNHFGNVSVGLYPELPFAERAVRIADALAERRRRACHPAMRDESRAVAALPAALLRWGVANFDPLLRSPTVIGNTVVSSVHRGAADLTFGGTPVAFTAGYPGLSPMMSLVHGVHGIGDTVAISVHAAESAGDIDAYTERLAAALDRCSQPGGLGDGVTQA